jgi:hypothetical protein
MSACHGPHLCYSHRTGIPKFHTDGCPACEQARARGIVRPNAKAIPARRRGAAVYLLMAKKGELCSG